MQALEQKDLWPNPVYQGVRELFRREVIAAKQHRRVDVGPVATFVFENRLTVKFQVQEILFHEKIEGAAHVQEELDGFNTMLPGEGELSATLLFGFVGPEPEVAAQLHRLTGLGSHLFLELGGKRVPGVVEGGREDGKRISAVQYVRFPVGPEATAALLDPAKSAALVIDHPHYPHRAVLTEGVRRSLAQDLSPAAAGR